MKAITAPKYRGPADVTLVRYHTADPGRTTAWQLLHGLAPGPDGDCDANETPEGMCPVLCGFAETVTWSFDDDAVRTASCLPLLRTLAGSETTPDRARTRARHLARCALTDYAPGCARSAISVCDEAGVPCEAVKAALAGLTADPRAETLAAVVEALVAAIHASRAPISAAWDVAYAAFEREHGAPPPGGDGRQAERERYANQWSECLKQDAAHRQAQWVYDRINWGWHGCDEAASALRYAESDEPDTVALSASCAALSARAAGRLKEAAEHLGHAITL